MANLDEELLVKLKNRDAQTIEQIVRLHTSHIYNACLGLGFSEVESDDLTQSVWLTFFDVVHKFEGRSSIRTFLFGIMYNKASEFRKQNNKTTATEDIEDLLDSHFDKKGHWILAHSPVNPDRFMESCQTLSLISNCIELLPLNQKMAFILKEVEEEITEEICKVLDVTASNLGVLIFRARNQLRECLDYKSR